MGRADRPARQEIANSSCQPPHLAEVNRHPAKQPAMTIGR